jgi:hypothetical protein
MDYHHHARLTIYRREELAKSVIQGRLSAAKWVARFRREGLGPVCAIVVRVPIVPRAAPGLSWLGGSSVFGASAGQVYGSLRPPP